MSKRLPSTTTLVAAAVAACFGSSALALPTDPVVVFGTAAISTQGSTMTINSGRQTWIDWRSFSIDRLETVNIKQASASSSILNQVVGSDPSLIYGRLISNGNVWVINTAGVLVGSGAVIDTAGFVASTLKVRLEDFLAARLIFRPTPGALDVRVEPGALITASSGGSVYLIGANVTNSGTITVPNGEVILAAGNNSISLVDTATPGVRVDLSGTATNLGEIVATAGRIGLSGALVRNSGRLDASSAVSKGGRIFLLGTKESSVDGAATIDVTGTKGGEVRVLGDTVRVADRATIDASGTGGGGTILLGGNARGADPSVLNAKSTYFGPEASMKANATVAGNGGHVVVWSDQTATVSGNIQARGAGAAYRGGSVETSARQSLDTVGIRVDTRTPGGRTGTWLLDPASLVIDTAKWISDYEPNLRTTNWTIATTSGGTGDIIFSTGTYASNSTNSLTLLAYGGDGPSNGNIDATSARFALKGPLTMVAGWDGGSTTSPVVATGNHATISVPQEIATSKLTLIAGGAIAGSSSTIVAKELNASSASGAIDLTGSNRVASVTLDAGGGDIAYRSAASVATMNASARGAIDIQSSGDVELGLLQVTDNVSGSISIESGGRILDGNGIGKTNLVAPAISLTSAGSISADVESPSVDALVRSSTVLGGIRIQQNAAAVAPTNVSLSDYSASGYVDYRSVGNIKIDSPYDLYVQKGKLSVRAGGNLDIASASGLRSSGALELHADGDMTVGAGGLTHYGTRLALAARKNLTTFGAVELSPDEGLTPLGLTLSAGDTLKIAAPLSAAGSNLSLSGTLVHVASTGGMADKAHVGNVNIGARDILIEGAVQATFNANLDASNSLTVTNGGKVLTDGNINVATAGTVTLDAGGLEALNHVTLDLSGSNSQIRISNGGGIYANGGATSGLIKVAFTGRSSGGILLDGTEVTFVAGTSNGFFNNYNVATPGQGMTLSYQGSFDSSSYLTGCHFRGGCEGAYSPTKYAGLSLQESFALAEADTIGGGTGQFGGADNGTASGPRKDPKKRPGQCR